MDKKEEKRWAKEIEMLYKYSCSVKAVKEKKEPTVWVTIEIPKYMVEDPNEFGYEILQLVIEKLKS